MTLMSKCIDNKIFQAKNSLISKSSASIIIMFPFSQPDKSWSTKFRCFMPASSAAKGFCNESSILLHWIPQNI